MVGWRPVSKFEKRSGMRYAKLSLRVFFRNAMKKKCIEKVWCSNGSQTNFSFALRFKEKPLELTDGSTFTPSRIVVLFPVLSYSNESTKPRLS